MNAPLSNPIAKSTLLLLALAFLCLNGSRAETPPAPTTAPPPADPAQPQPPPGGPRQTAKAEWVETNQTAPNGTQYQTFSSKVLGHDVSYLVYLPPDYDKDPSKRYPVLYWLHGMGGNQRGGATMFVPHLAEATQKGILSPTIVILVNGMVNAFYCDSADGQVPMESVIIKDLIPHVDATYRTIARREDRIIEGYSMGGFGAAHLGFKYPELFGTVVVNAGALIDPSFPMMTRIFGNDLPRATAEHPMQLVRQNADKLRGQTHIRIGCGSVDHLLAKNTALHELLDELHIANDFVVVPDIAHDSVHYYQKLGPKVFEFHQKSLEAVEGAVGK